MSVKKRVVLSGMALPVLLLLACVAFLQPISKSDAYLYVDEDDTADSVCIKLQPSLNGLQATAFKLLSKAMGFNVHSGRYLLTKKNALRIYRNVRGGNQDAVKLTIPSVRTMEDLAGHLSHKLMLDSLTLVNAFRDSARCAAYGYDTYTIPCMFIPNTYDVYWNLSIDKLYKRMQRENKNFWTSERLAKAEKAGLTPNEVITMASIVDEETANNGEKPDVAGMYINRLHIGMPLQADPTIKYAWHRFDLRRIYHALLKIKSPYNTYINVGLPPGPIRIPSVAGIDAVLNYTHHKYLYMCAKEDFSGTHNFAETYGEHLKNAASYSAALNARGIK